MFSVIIIRIKNLMKEELLSNINMRLSFILEKCDYFIKIILLP